jgi:ribosomal protein S18 acetylase RimI-like enzyme
MNRKAVLLVAYRENVPCGFLYAYLLDSPNSVQPKMFLYSIDVFENHQRGGIGTCLIRYLKRIGKRENCSEIFVLTNRSNNAAMKLYESTGGKKDNTDDVMFVYSVA